MRDVCRSCRLAVPVDRAFEAVQTPAVLETIARPLFTFVPLDPPAFPPRWQARDYRVGVRLFGVIPLGQQVIGPRFPEAATPDRVFLDVGHSTVFRIWEHRITLTPVDDGTRMTDCVSFDAGVLTRPAGLVLRLFFAHRHRRLQRLLAANG